MPDPRDEITPKQQEVLRLTQQGKGPTEVGKSMGISSQAVHGHLRRLRKHGLLPKNDTPQRERGGGSGGGDDNGFDAAGALEAVRRTAELGIAKAEQRQRDIDLTMTGLSLERAELETTIAELRKHLPATSDEEGEK